MSLDGTGGVVCWHTHAHLPYIFEIMIVLCSTWTFTTPQLSLKRNCRKEWRAWDSHYKQDLTVVVVDCVGTAQNLLCQEQILNGEEAHGASVIICIDNSESSGKRVLTKKCLDQVSLWVCLWELSLLLTDGGRPSLFWAVPFSTQDILNNKEKKKKKAGWEHVSKNLFILFLVLIVDML